MKNRCDLNKDNKRIFSRICFDTFRKRREKNTMTSKKTRLTYFVASHFCDEEKLNFIFVSSFVLFFYFEKKPSRRFEVTEKELIFFKLRRNKTLTFYHIWYRIIVILSNIF